MSNEADGEDKLQENRVEEPTRQTVHDPVCHMDIVAATSVANAEYEGLTYYFCSEQCQKEFVADPARVILAEAEHHQEQSTPASEEDIQQDKGVDASALTSVDASISSGSEFDESPASQGVHEIGQRNGNQLQSGGLSVGSEAEEPDKGMPAATQTTMRGQPGRPLQEARGWVATQLSSGPGTFAKKQVDALRSGRRTARPNWLLAALPALGVIVIMGFMLRRAASEREGVSESRNRRGIKKLLPPAFMVLAFLAKRIKTARDSREQSPSLASPITTAAEEAEIRGAEAVAAEISRQADR